MPTNQDPERAAFAEGFSGTELSELAAMPDAELAQWQSGWKQGTENHILAEKEWTRRLTMRQLLEQYKYEERLARANRWWSIAAAVLGVVGTLAGAWVGARLASASSSEKTQATTLAPALGTSLTVATPASAASTSPTASSPK